MKTLDITHKLEALTKEIVGNVFKHSPGSAIDFFIDLDIEDAFNKPIDEDTVVLNWKVLVESYLNTCKCMFPESNDFGVVWGTKPTTTNINDKYMLYASFLILPKDGRNFSKRLLFCPHCSKSFELRTAFQEKEADLFYQRVEQK